jgi:MazG family protein
VIERLRGEGGCPWDREQTLSSLKPQLIEEAYELVEAVESDDPAWHAEELGDLLLHIALHCQIRREQGRFDFNAVAHGIADKLIRRHPHVFGDVAVSGASEVLRNWEAIKAAEKQDSRRSALDGVPRALPALLRAHRVQTRAARVGFDWKQVSDVAAKVEEELTEVREAIAAGRREDVEREAGDLLFAVVNLCRFQGLSAEEALSAAVARFVTRFQAVEQRVAREGRRPADCTLDELDAHWNAVKEEEKGKRIEGT